ncbi:hypothetical protein [Streptomyces mangrovisoli]|uniref:Uncharacterized protein n=1 Tax=Streptomyces mangrovisoli TaxID=1428628 RepID=A0A1J4NQB6_9ACTN|nr:hypothetical protein [Streptomyces mangrovisoli]OIJ64330.1 hypothetical protein WN71_029715 [Streptomyces mangrovisoli]
MSEADQVPEQSEDDSTKVEKAAEVARQAEVAAHSLADAVLQLQRLDPERETSMVSDPAGSGGSCHNISCF